MSLRELVWSDSRALIADSGESASFSPPESLGLSAFVAPVKFIRRGMTKDPENVGFAVIGESASLSVSLLELASFGVTDPESIKVKGWLVTIDNTSFRLDAAPIDYTLGVATVTLKRSEA
jgi:hypothetical protein